MGQDPRPRLFFWLFECCNLFLDRLAHQLLIPLNLQLVARHWASDAEITSPNKEEEYVDCRNLVRDLSDPVLFQSLLVLCTETPGPVLSEYDL
jgi:hypothetical protein